MDEGTKEEEKGWTLDTNCVALWPDATQEQLRKAEVWIHWATTSRSSPDRRDSWKACLQGHKLGKVCVWVEDERPETPLLPSEQFVQIPLQENGSASGVGQPRWDDHQWAGSCEENEIRKHSQTPSDASSGASASRALGWVAGTDLG